MTKFRARPLPEIDDPLALEIMTLVAQSNVSWAKLEVNVGAGCDTVRHWFYKPTWNPRWQLVTSVLEFLGYRLKLEKIEPDGGCPA